MAARLSDVAGMAGAADPARRGHGPGSQFNGKD
jgi:hypothetical protein